MQQTEAQEDDAVSGEYDDIINLPHHVSLRYPQMDLIKRAAQFAPFAALTGYDDAIEETARLTQEEITLGEDSLEELDRALMRIKSAPEGARTAEITYYVPDVRKEGGEYRTITAEVLRIDDAAREIVLEGKQRIAVDRIIAIRFPESSE